MSPTQSERREATPGPWLAHKPKMRSAAWRVTLTPGDAHGDLANVLSGLGARTADEVAANAHLMAAARDLRDAVRSLLKLHIAHHNTPEHVAARAALAKADTTEEG